MWTAVFHYCSNFWWGKESEKSTLLTSIEGFWCYGIPSPSPLQSFHLTHVYSAPNNANITNTQLLVTSSIISVPLEKHLLTCTEIQTLSFMFLLHHAVCCQTIIFPKTSRKTMTWCSKVIPSKSSQSVFILKFRSVHLLLGRQHSCLILWTWSRNHFYFSASKARSVSAQHTAQKLQNTQQSW